MKLHVFPPSPNARQVQITVAQLGLDVETVIVNLAEGQQRAPEFLALNPNGLMPVLEDGGFVLWESTAIMQYLATQEPGRKLWPENARQQADVSRWQSWRLAHWGPACGTFTFENLVKKLLGAGEPDAAVLAKGEENFHKYASVLDAHLKGRQYVVGDDMTLADIAIGSWLTYREPAKMPIEKYTEILRWHDALEKQDAWKKVPGGFS